MLTPNASECNSMLTSVASGIYPYPDTYIDKGRIRILQLVLCRYQFHPKPFPPPRDKALGHTRLEGSKNPPPGTIIVYKNPPLGTEHGVKSPTPGT